MAIRIYCDSCKEEILNGEIGTLNYFERETFLVFEKHQKKDQQGLVKKESILCNKCIKRIKELVKI